MPDYFPDSVLVVEGVAVARHRQMPESLLPLSSRAWNLFQQLLREDLFPLTVEIENSRIVRMCSGDRNLLGDIADELLETTNRRRELVLVEMAFSTNGGVDPSVIDWTKNSQLNEGALGIHVGIGDGLTGAHIDLICPGVELST